MNLNFIRFGSKPKVAPLKNIPAKKLMLSKILAVMKRVDLPGETQSQKKNFFSKHNPFFMTDKQVDEIYYSLKKMFK